MGFLFSKPHIQMIDKSTSIDVQDLYSNEMEEAILNGNIYKVKQIKNYYNVVDAVYLAVKTNQMEILKHLRKNLQIPRYNKKVKFNNKNEVFNLCK